MGIWNRLGSVINSYLNDFGEQTSEQFKSFKGKSRGDPDLDAAYDELNDFLNGNERENTPSDNPRRDNSFRRESSSQHKTETNTKKSKLPPEELRADFEYLGVPFGADKETCKAAYKKLLKIHHPDRHAGHEGNFKKATAKSAKINAAWDRIENWRQTAYFVREK